MSNTEVWKSWEGRVVGGKFPLRQWLGGSDHSAVFLTDRQGQSDQKAAIKLIAEVPAEAERQRSRWRAAAQLSHPNLIRIYEIGRCQMNDASLLYVVTEYAEEDLSQILPQRPLAPTEVTDLLPPLLDALSYLHGKGLVHRRIKPSNVLAVGDLLKLSSDQVAAPADSGGEGKRRDVYDAPETESGIISPAGDLWSVGATLVEALTQKPPFAEETPLRDRGVPATVPEPFRGIARECLHVDPKRRCSIAEIKARMQPAARSVPEEAKAPAPPEPRVKRGPIVAALLAVTLVVGIIVFYPRGKSVPAPASATTAPPASQTASHPSSPTASQTISQPATQTTRVAAPPPTPKPAVREPAQAPKKVSASPGEVVRQVIPDVPKSAKNTITGTIKVGVQVEVDSSGKVTTAKLVSAGPSKYFANLALKAAEQWEFSPLEVNGKAAASTWLLKFRFKRTATQADPQRVGH
jgi:TonB family protein